MPKSFSTLYGSKWVASGTVYARTPVAGGFSTLYGSKWVATHQGSLYRSPGEGFQYPLRVEVGCNNMACLRTLTPSRFQYPLRVEVGCNASCKARFHAQYRFQYPLRVEVGCNRIKCKSSTSHIRVSVPSTGRSGLQLARACVLPASSSSFSTLYGSKWVATFRLWRLAHGNRGFSTLYGSKWVATSMTLQHTETMMRVSVPSTGRSGLQL